MKNKTASKNGFFTFRVLIGVLLCFAGVMIVLFALGKAAYSAEAAAKAGSVKAHEPVITCTGGHAACLLLG